MKAKHKQYRAKKSTVVSISIFATLKEGKKKTHSQRRQDKRYRDGRAYMDGITELCSHVLCTQNTVADAAELTEKQEKVRASLCQLSETQQRRIYLFYYLGYNKREIAELEGVSHQNVSKSIRRALRILKTLLE